MHQLCCSVVVRGWADGRCLSQQKFVALMNVKGVIRSSLGWLHFSSTRTTSTAGDRIRFSVRSAQRASGISVTCVVTWPASTACRRTSSAWFVDVNILTRPTSRSTCVRATASVVDEFQLHLLTLSMPASLVYLYTLWCPTTYDLGRVSIRSPSILAYCNSKQPNDEKICEWLKSTEFESLTFHELEHLTSQPTVVTTWNHYTVFNIETFCRHKCFCPNFFQFSQYNNLFLTTLALIHI